jgi:hypothetical protein
MRRICINEKNSGMLRSKTIYLIIALNLFICKNGFTQIDTLTYFVNKPLNQFDTLGIKQVIGRSMIL